MRRVTAVHSTFWLNGTFRSGDETSGSIGKNGRTKFKNRTKAREWWLRKSESMIKSKILTTRHDGRGVKTRKVCWRFNAIREYEDVALSNFKWHVIKDILI